MSDAIVLSALADGISGNWASAWCLPTAEIDGYGLSAAIVFIYLADGMSGN